MMAAFPGHLPDPGGLYQQPAPLLDALEALQIERLYWQETRHHEARRE